MLLNDREILMGRLTGICGADIGCQKLLFLCERTYKVSVAVTTIELGSLASAGRQALFLGNSIPATQTL